VFGIFGKGDPSDLKNSMDRVLRDLETLDMDSEEYKTRLAHVERLSKLRNEERSNRISPDTLAIVTTNLLGILIIVGYERGNVLASKGLGFILRTKHHG
jgi:hypothetical protein